MYIDIIKQFVKVEKELEAQILAVSRDSKNIEVEFAIEKYVMLNLRRGKCHTIGWIEFPYQEKIGSPGEMETYTYLGIFEADSIIQVDMKEKHSLDNEKTTRNQTIEQKFHQGIDTWAVSFTRYSYNS